MKLLSLTTVVASLLTSVLARSSVHVVSNNANQLETKPEISMNAFSMFYSHLMDSTSNYPILRLQNDDVLQQVQDISPIFPKSDNLFEKKLDGNLVVIVSGVGNSQDVLSTVEPSFYVDNDTPDAYANAINEVLRNEESLATFKNHNAQIRSGITFEELSLQKDNAFENFKSDFASFNVNLFDAEKQVDIDFINEVESIRELSKTEKSNVKFIQVDSLQSLGQTYGIESEKFKEAQLIMKDLFENLVIPNFQQSHVRYASTFILTPYTKQNYKRDVPKASIEGTTCFKSVKDCKNATSSCSGNGQCALISDNCYACQCSSSSHVGESCQYVNAVGEFQLLFWTSIFLIVVTSSVVVCVYQSGSNAESGIILTQSVPKHD